jgi:transcriptional regulator with XRE-family HTH domain
MQRRKVISSASIGAKIKQRRLDLKMSQEELAEAMGITYQQVQRYEKGANKLNVESLQLIAGLLAVSPAYFFDVSDVSVIAEDRARYTVSEEDVLIRQFRKIKNKKSRNTVLQVVRLAAKSE